MSTVSQISCPHCSLPIEFDLKVNPGKNTPDIEKIVYTRVEKITKKLVNYKKQNKELKKQLEDALRKTI